MTEINGNPKVQYLVNMVDESELSGQAVTVFAWLSMHTHWLCIFCWLIPDAFVKYAFSWSN